MGLARMVLTRNQGSHDGRARLHHGAGTRVTFLRTPVGTAPADPIHERWTRATWPSPSDRPPTRQTSSHASAANEPTKEGTVHLSDPRLPPEREARHLARIRAYYDETWLDYRWLWLNRHNYALHFGYWDAHTRTHAAALLNLNRVLARALAIRPGQRILDAGCGVGGSAIWLAQTFGAEVVGITPVPSQVDRARRHARATGVADRVTFEQQDYTHTTFPDRSFDYVWAIESVCHAPDKRAVLREARRVLRPGGRLGVIEYVRTGRPHAPADERLLQRWLSDWAIPDLATGAELVHSSQAAGFEAVRLVDITRAVQPSLRRLFWLATLLGPGESLLYALGLRSARQHGNTRGARDQYRAARRGLWVDAMLTAGISAG